MIDLRNYIKDVPDFPKPGILFRDISPLLAHVEAREKMVDDLGVVISETQPTILAGLDARGFLIGGLLAQKYQLPLMMVRKSGKLPGKTTQVPYDLEYGSNSIEIQDGILGSEDRVLLIDDLLATGGTLGAAIKLISTTPAQIVGCACVIELIELGGRSHLANIPTYSLIQY